VFAAALVILALWVIRSYAVALAWAVVIVIGIWPLYQRFAPRSLDQRKKSFRIVQCGSLALFSADFLSCIASA
jgi:predicted PurR-regulated permease PerM